MRLIINAGSVFKGGSEQVALSFIHECIKFPEHAYHVVIAPNLAGQLDMGKFPDNFTFHQIQQRPASSIINFIRLMLWYSKLESKVKPDCVISTGGHGNWRPRAPLVGGFNIPHYVYPESPYFNGMPLKKRLYWKLMRIIQIRLYNRLDAVLVQTEDVKVRLNHLLSKDAPIYVISNTVNAHYLQGKPASPKLPSRQPGEIRLITLSSYYPHKNLEIIDSVTKVLINRGLTHFKFIVTLPKERFEVVLGSNTTGLIFNVGQIPVKDCPSLYEECDYMFLPTLLECFSASYAEAMLMRKPILTSDLSFAHTVCKDAAIYFNPVDPQNIADSIILLSEDKDLQNALINKGEQIFITFNSPEDRARKFLEICDHISKTGQG